MLLALGVRFDDRTSSSWLPGYSFTIPPTRLIHVDIDPDEIGRNYPVALGLMADVRTFLRQVLGELDARQDSTSLIAGPIASQTGSQIAKQAAARARWLEAIAGYRREWDAFVAPGWVSDNTFLAGYGAAQAVPGPLFTFAAYLGAVVQPSPHGLPGAVLGLVGIFLPGMLLLLGALPFWHGLRTRSGAQAAMRGINAAVVGLLGAALYNPVWTSSINTSGDLSVALISFVLLTKWRAPPLLVVIVDALAGIALV